MPRTKSFERQLDENRKMSKQLCAKWIHWIFVCIHLVQGFNVLNSTKRVARTSWWLLWLSGFFCMSLFLPLPFLLQPNHKMCFYRCEFICFWLHCILLKDINAWIDFAYLFHVKRWLMGNEVARNEIRNPNKNSFHTDASEYWS